MIEAFRKHPSWSKPGALLMLNTGAHEANTHSRPAPTRGVDLEAARQGHQIECACVGGSASNPYVANEGQKALLVSRDGGGLRRHSVVREGNITKLFFNHTRGQMTYARSQTATLSQFASGNGFHPLEAMADLALGHTLACLGQSKGCAEREGEVIAAWAKQVTSITKRVRESGGFGGRIVLRTSLINFGFDQRGAENRVKLHMNAFLRKMAASSTPSSPGDTGPGPSRSGIYVLDVEALTMQRPETVSIMHVGSVRNTKKLIYATNVGNVG